LPLRLAYRINYLVQLLGHTGSASRPAGPQMALGMSLTAFLASPNTIMVLSVWNKPWSTAGVSRRHAALEHQRRTRLVDLRDRRIANRVARQVRGRVISSLAPGTSTTFTLATPTLTLTRSTTPAHPLSDFVHVEHLVGWNRGFGQTTRSCTWPAMRPATPLNLSAPPALRPASSSRRRRACGCFPCRTADCPHPHIPTPCCAS